MKMYILIKASVLDKLVPVITAHASLACYLQYRTHPDMETWIGSVFKKVVCVVDDVQFERMKSVENHTLLTESALDNTEVCLAFCPRETYPKDFKFFRMWSPQHSH